MNRTAVATILLVVVILVGGVAVVVARGQGETLRSPADQVCLNNLRRLSLAVLMYAADHDETLPPGDVGSDRGGSQGREFANLASWKSVTLRYVTDRGTYECPKARAGLAMARTGFSAEAWPGNWSENDFVWVDCAPESPLYTNDPGCAYSGGAFFPRSYALNGAPFGVAFIIGKPTRRGIKCLDCNSRPMSLAGVPQPAETALVVNMKSIESLVLPTASVRCWAEMGDDQYPDHSFPDPTSPTGKRRKVSWFVAHSKGIQLSFADAHVNWMPLQQAYAANVFKYDCIRRGADARTWPMNQFHSDCGATSSTVCRAGAMALVAAEHI